MLNTFKWLCLRLDYPVYLNPGIMNCLAHEFNQLSRHKVRCNDTDVARRKKQISHC